MKDAKGHGSESGHARVAGIAAQHGIRGGPFKVQSLALGRVGKPWSTQKAYGNKAVAERVAQHMRTDGGYMRVRAK